MVRFVPAFSEKDGRAVRKEQYEISGICARGRKRIE